MNDDSANSAPITPNSIEGTWLPVRLEYAGESAPDMVIEKTVLHILGRKYRMHFGGEVTFEGVYSVAAAPENSPAHASLLIEGTRNPNKGKVLKGIFQIVGNRLRICVTADGPSPEAFSTKAGTTHYMATYRRKE